MSISYSQVMNFLTTVKYMNMNMAAKELYISQPGLSLSISKLEDELGITLFYRDNNKLYLSKEGRQLVPFFEQIRSSNEALLAAANDFTQTRPNYLNISFSGSIYFFNDFFMTGCLNSYNNMIIKLCYVDLEQAVSMLVSQQTDFAICSMPIKHPQITTTVVLTNPIGLVVRTNHPFAKRESVAVEDLGNIRIYGLKPENMFRQMYESILEPLGIVLSYASEDGYSSYYKCMYENDGTGGFLSMKATYDANFKVIGEYAWLPITGVDMSQNISISYLIDGDKRYLFDGTLNYIKKCIADINVTHNMMGDCLLKNMVKH